MHIVHCTTSIISTTPSRFYPHDRMDKKGGENASLPTISSLFLDYISLLTPWPASSLCLFFPFGTRAQRDGRGLDPCLPCVIKIMSVFCVHKLLEHKQLQLDLPEACIWAAPPAPEQGKRHCPSGKAAWTASILQRASMLGHLSSLRPHFQYHPLYFG